MRASERPRDTTPEASLNVAAAKPQVPAQGSASRRQPGRVSTSTALRESDAQYERRGLQRAAEVRRLRLRDVDQWPYRPMPARARLESARRAWWHLHEAGLMSELVDDVLRREAVA